MKALKYFKKKKLIILFIIIVLFGIFVLNPRTSIISYVTEYNTKKAALEELGDWDFNMIMYDSAVDKGKTQLTEHAWNATTNETRVLTVQVNFRNTNVNRNYNPGELKITVDNLGVVCPQNSTNTSWATTTSISADKKNSATKEYDWSYTYDSTTNKYIFTNNYVIEANSNFEGTIQLAYSFEAQYLLNGAEVELNAVLNDVLESSNKLKFSFTSTEKEADISKTANKISSYDGFGAGAEDYIWVKYYVRVATDSSQNVRGKTYDDYVIEEALPNVKVLDGNLKEIYPEENGKYIISPFTGSNSSNTSSNSSSGSYNYRYGNYYVGYPIDIYDGQTIEATTKWYGKLRDSYYYNGNEKEEKLLAEKTVELNLDDFKFNYSGNLYSVSKNRYTLYSYQCYNKIINSNYGDDINYELDLTARYNGKKFTARIGDDLLYITGEDGNYRKLNEDEYYFKSVYIPDNFKNANNVTLEKDKYDIKLFVKYKDTNEYVQYGETLKNGIGKTITFLEDEKVTRWYLEIYELEESLITNASIDTYVHIQTNNNLKETGQIYNFNYLQILTKDDSGNDVLENELNLEDYGSTLTQLNIATYDMETYGKYLQRDYISTQYGVEKMHIYPNSFGVTSSQDNEYFYRDFQFCTSYGYYTNVGRFNGYRMYNLFPLGVEINGKEKDIIENISTWSFNYNVLLKEDGSKFTQEEYIQFIKEHTTINIDKNYKNTGRLWVEIIVDYSDSPLNLYNAAHNYTYAEMFTIPTKISYESYFTNGATYTARSYTMLLNDEELYLPYSKCTDVDDIDNDGDTTDYYTDSSSPTTTIVPAVSSYQEVNKSIWTENTENQWTTDVSSVKYNGIYKYKLRVRTGVNSITNLVIYDNLELNGGWQGTFDGIDLTFTNGQGYTPKVYYSTSNTAGKLNEDPDSWHEYTEDIDKTTVRSLAFDYGDNIINSGDLTYVIINMKSPINIDTTTLACNRCYTTWRAIDQFGNVIDSVTGIDSNVSLVAVPNVVTELKVRKVWEDNDNELGVRPENITVNLLRNGEQYQTAILDESKNWEHTFEVPVCDDDGNKYNYTVEEQNINLYTSQIENTDAENKEGILEKSYTITNTLNEDDAYIDIIGSKIWNDDNNEKNRRPESITINLLRDGVKVASISTDASKNWLYDFNNYPLWKNNTEKYVYTIQEDGCQYYSQEIKREVDNGLKIKFNSQCRTESVAYDYVEIYYKLNDKAYKLGKWGGSDLANKEVIVPSKDFYLYWITDHSNCNYYGFKIDSIEKVPTRYNNTTTATTLPEYTAEEITGFTYPESEHTYQDNVNKMWHYTANVDIPTKDGDFIIYNITNTYRKIPAKVLVHHYIEGTTNRLSDDVTINGLVWDEYTTSVATDIPEYYELVETPANATGEFTENQIEVNYYYRLKNYNYRVEYYYDGVIDNSKTETQNTVYGTLIRAYKDKNIPGYRLMRTEEGQTAGIAGLEAGTVGLPLTVTENEDTNVIKVYYVKDQFKYRVEYYYDGNIDIRKTDEFTANYKDVISTYTDKNITGYRLMTTEEGKTAGMTGLKDGVVGLPLTISENSANNVIKVYYVKDKFNYTVEYYYDGIKDDSKTDTIKATYQEKITTYTDKNITGYRLMTTEEGKTAGITGLNAGTVGLPLTISENPSNNIIKVYYVKDQFKYRVEYYYDGNIDIRKTDEFTANYKDVISTYTDKNITGYRLMTTEEGKTAGMTGLKDGVVGLPLTISENYANNVIKVYYVKDKFNYTVEYYYDGVKDDSKTDTIKATYQEKITTYTDKNITGYRLMTTEEGKTAGITGLKDGAVGLPLTVSENSENNIIKVYYVKDQFKYRVEYYYDGNIDIRKTDQFTATYQDVISTYTDKNIPGYRLMTTEEGEAEKIANLKDGTVGLPLTISENTDNNVIKVYYVKD